MHPYFFIYLYIFFYRRSSSYLYFVYRQLQVISIYFLRRTVTTRYVVVCVLKITSRGNTFWALSLCRSVWQQVCFAVANTHMHVCLVIDWCSLILKMLFSNQTLELFPYRSCFQLVPCVPKHTGNKQFFFWRNQFL